MRVIDFIFCLIAIAVCFGGFYVFPIRHSPKGINVKKLKVKRFAFLFCIDKEYNFGYLPDATKENKCKKGKPYKEVPIKLFVFLIIGYTINFLACIATITCFCLNIDITKYIAIVILSEFALLVLFAAII